MLDAPNVEFLQLCRLALKGERSDSDLAEAIRTARANLLQLKREVLAETSTPSEKSLQLKPPIDALLASIQSYAGGIDLIESYLPDHDKVSLAKGMEHVRQAIAKIEIGFHRYQVAILATHGPTDMPGYNFVANAVEKYTHKNMSQKDLETLLRAAHDSVQKSIALLTSHLYLKEVAKLREAYQAHQEALASLKTSLKEGKPLEEIMRRFQKSCELIRDTKVPAEIKILTEKPTPSSAANFMINLTHEMVSGNVHPSYFSEAFKHLKMEYKLFSKEMEAIAARITPRQLKEGREALQLYSRALEGFKTFQETLQPTQLPKASMQLKKAVLRLYEIFNTSQAKFPDSNVGDGKRTVGE